jgi:hypothetical protein
MDKALEYAEHTLGVHTVHEEAVAARTLLDQSLTSLAEARDRLRDIELKVSDREMEVTIDQRSKHPDMAITRWDKHIKESFRDDDDLRALREQLYAARSDIEGYEFDVKVHETDIRIAVARMTELGGYLIYLAEVKRSKRPERPEQSEEQKQ